MVEQHAERARAGGGVAPFTQVMLHELGHAAGLAHFNSIIGLMDTNMAFGGNAGIGVDATANPLPRINADEQYMLSDLRTGGLLGREYLLYKFERVPKDENPNPGSPGKSREIWTDAAAADPYHFLPEGWQACAGGTLTGIDEPYPPYFPYAAMQSDVVEAQPISVKFGLSSSNSLGSCSTAAQVAYSDVALTTGTPAPARPYLDDPFQPDPVQGWCIPTGTPAGMYNVCAYVEESDSSDYDDEIYSDKLFGSCLSDRAAAARPAS